MNNLQKYVQQLKSTDPAARRDAIIALGKAGNAAAIRPLAEVSESDPEPTLREFARKAVLHIKKVQSQSAQTVDVTPEPPQAPTPYGLIEEPSDALIGLSPVASAPEIILPTEPSGPPPKEPSAREKLLAKGNLDHGLGLRVSGDNEKAFIMLTEALRLDPALARESTAMNLASVLLNKPPKEAIQIVLQRSQDDRTRPKEGVGSGVRSLSVDKQVWDFALEAAILLVVLILFSVVLNFGVVRMLNSLMSSIQLSSQLSAERAAELETQAELVRSQINAITPSGLVFNAMKDGAILLFVILLGNSITYGVGTLLGGTGLVFRFLSTMARVQIVTYFAVGAVLAFALFIDVQNTIAKNSSTAFVWIGAIMIMISGFLSFVAHVYFAGRAHEMNFAKGFLAVVVGGFISSFLIQILGIFS